MSSYIRKEWEWTVNAVLDSAPVENININTWEIDAQTVVSGITDASGQTSTVMPEALYKIDGEDDVVETRKTPHTVSVCKYGLVPKGLVLAFIAPRIDTFYLEVNEYIAEADATVVKDYTGIDIDHDNKSVTVSENHTLQEVYDYCQLELVDTPTRDFPVGILTTSNGTDYELFYDLHLDDITLSGTGKYIDMANNELILTGSAGTEVKVLDKNGILVSLTLTGLKSNSEVRVYRTSDMTELAGIEDSGETYSYSYTWSEDVPALVVVYGVGYDPIRLEVLLNKQGGTIPIQQRKDRWYKNV